MKTINLLFFLLTFIPAFSQYTLYFDSSGKLTGEPPEKLKKGESVDAVLTLSAQDMKAIVSDAAKRHLSLYNSLEFADSVFGDAKTNELRKECLYNLYQIQLHYPDYLDETSKVEFARIGNITRSVTTDPKTTYFPVLKTLLNPKYILEMIQLDKNGKQLGHSLQILTGKDSSANIFTRYSLPNSVKILKDFDRFEIQVRKQNSNWEFFQQKKTDISLSEFDNKTLNTILKKSEITYLALDSAGLSNATREISLSCDSLMTELLIRFPGSYVKADFLKYIDSIFTRKKAAVFNWASIFTTKKTTEKHSFGEIDFKKLVEDYLLDYNKELGNFHGIIKKVNSLQDVDESKIKVFLAINPKFKIFEESFHKYSKRCDFDALYAKAKDQYALYRENPDFKYDSEFLLEIEHANGYLQQYVLPQLKRINQQTAAKSLQEVIIQQLWLTNSEWMELNIIQRVRNGGNGEPEKKGRTIESVTAEIAVLQVQIDFLNALSGNLTIHTKGDSLPIPDHYLKLIKDLQNQKNDKNTELKKLEKSNTSSSVSPESLAAKLGLETSDFLLNKVVFGPNLMHHIDYTEKQFMNRRPTQEINEMEVLDIFVHNDKAATDYLFKYTFTKSDKDVTVLEEQMTFNAPQSNSGSKDPKVFLQNYVLVKIYKEIAASQFTAIPPKTLPRSEKPQFQTNKVNAKIKPGNIMEVPGKVNYKVLNPLNDKDTIAAGAYRVNKLYRFRYKIGPSYSWLTQRHYTLNEDQTYTLDEKKAGLQTVFGLQYYFLRNDIRKQEPKRQFFAFLGLNIGTDIVENIYLGAGYEIVDGMSITAGFHFGMTEKLYSRNGILAVDERAWSKPAPFITLGFDHGIFKALFKNNIRTSNTTIFK